MNYLSSETLKTLTTRYKFTSLIVVIFGITVVVYMLIGRMIAISTTRDLPPQLYKGFYWAALALGFLAVMLRRVMLSKMQLSLLMRKGPGAVIGRLSMASIICAALAEAVGILGLSATLLTGNTDFNWRLGVVSLLLVAYSFPRRWEWESLATAAERANESQAAAPAVKLFT